MAEQVGEAEEPAASMAGRDLARAAVTTRPSRREGESGAPPGRC